MAKIGELYQTADWKSEKHVPVIECPDAVAADETFEVKVSLGKEVAHPNTTEHHIRWIQLYFRPGGDKFCLSGRQLRILRPRGVDRRRRQRPRHHQPFRNRQLENQKVRDSFCDGPMQHSRPVGKFQDPDAQVGPWFDERAGIRRFHGRMPGATFYAFRSCPSKTCTGRFVF